MRTGVIVADTRRPADVYGVHGTAGLTHWTCLARRAALRGDWEAVEWAGLPPGAVSGEHLHTRTEEVYLLLRGRGELTLDGRRRQLAAGDLVLTALGSRHGLRNTGNEPLEWLVIELTATKRPTAPAPVEPRPRSAVITGLPALGRIDPRTVLSGPLRTIGIVRLRAGERTVLRADGEEHTVFVTAGDGRAAPLGTGSSRSTAAGSGSASGSSSASRSSSASGSGSGELRVPLAPGTALTLPLGTGAALTAGRGGLEYVHAALTVPKGGPTS